MPRRSSGTRNVARSLTTAISLHRAICSPPPWHSPLTADTTGLTDWRSVSNGVTSMPSADAERQPVVAAVAAAHIAAGREDVAGAGDQQTREIGIGVDMADRIADAEVHRGGHRVACLGPVQRAHTERPLAGETQVWGAEPVAVGWAVAARRSSS